MQQVIQFFICHLRAADIQHVYIKTQLSSNHLNRRGLIIKLIVISEQLNHQTN
ncbi:hypothetical protein D3C80_1930340 [compost metagenome]